VPSELTESDNWPTLNETRIFAVDLNVDPQLVRRYESILNPEERARAERFLLPELRRRFAVCRGSLRQILGGFLAMAPSKVEFSYERWGKPKLCRPSTVGLHFNVSHSREWALIAVAQSSVGIDLEIPTHRFEHRSIASQVVSPREQSSWNSIPASEKNRGMLRLWVCKEALLKAMGLGIAEGLRQVSFDLPINEAGDFHPTAIDSTLMLHLDDDGSCRSQHWIDARAWRLRLLEPIPGCFAAIATLRQVTQHTITKWEAM
jgi:4'-phosphopantetheinyl transferase